MGSRQGETDETIKNKGVALTFNPLTLDMNALPELRRNRRCSSGNTFNLGRKVIVFGGLSKDGEMLDLGNLEEGWKGLPSYKGFTKSNLTESASCTI
jgi:hypothetical protein